MKTLPLGLTPGQDLRAALEAAVQSQNCLAALVLSGTVAVDGGTTSSHVHMAVSTATGKVLVWCLTLERT